MNIKSKQIVDEVELVIGKLLKDISIEDLKSITELIINNFDVDGSVNKFYLEDLDLFTNLKKLSFNDMIIDTDTLMYINNHNIEELNLFNCELLCDTNITFNNITTLRVEYTDNFKEEYLMLFPNLKELSFKGYKITKDLPKTITKLNLVNTTIEDLKVIDNMNLSDLYISKDEYEKNIDYYKKLLYVHVYDDNNIYLINSGDENE